MDCFMDQCSVLPLFFFSGNIFSDLFLWCCFPSFPRNLPSPNLSWFNICAFVYACILYHLLDFRDRTARVQPSLGRLIFTRVIRKFYGTLGFQLEIQINVWPPGSPHSLQNIHLFSSWYQEKIRMFVLDFHFLQTFGGSFGCMSFLCKSRSFLWHLLMDSWVTQVDVLNRSLIDQRSNVVF